VWTELGKTEKPLADPKRASNIQSMLQSPQLPKQALCTVHNRPTTKKPTNTNQEFQKTKLGQNIGARLRFVCVARADGIGYTGPTKYSLASYFLFLPRVGNTWLL
jgi:hypothetical protein